MCMCMCMLPTHRCSRTPTRRARPRAQRAGGRARRPAHALSSCAPPQLTPPPGCAKKPRRCCTTSHWRCDGPWCRWTRRRRRRAPERQVPTRWRPSSWGTLPRGCRAPARRFPLLPWPAVLCKFLKGGALPADNTAPPWRFVGWEFEPGGIERPKHLLAPSWRAGADRRVRTPHAGSLALCAPAPSVAPWLARPG